MTIGLVNVACGDRQGPLGSSMIAANEKSFHGQYWQRPLGIVPARQGR